MPKVTFNVKLNEALFKAEKVLACLPSYPPILQLRELNPGRTSVFPAHLVATFG